MEGTLHGALGAGLRVVAFDGTICKHVVQGVIGFVQVLDVLF